MGSAKKKLSQTSGDIVDWSWPAAPRTFRVYDKYADREVTLVTGERTWTLPRGEKGNNIYFAVDSAERRIQQTIVIYSQRDAAPAPLTTFTARLTANWAIGDPERIRHFWDVEVLEPARANVCKAILKIACASSAGPWSAKHLGVVEGLPTRSKASYGKQAARIKKRDRLVPVDAQAQIARVLDEANAYELKETHAEGLTALAFLFQHAVRPVQVLSLRIEHLKFTRDASDQLVCVISFHSAKQRSGVPVFEIPRQVKHEWVHIVECLYKHAAAAGRRSLFCVSSAGALWVRIRRVMRDYAGVEMPINALTLRHTGAQTLADAGHDRESIRNFLGHKNLGTANAYVTASRAQGELVNRAIGTSKLYGNILSLAYSEFVSVKEMLKATEDQQIGGVVGDRLVAGIGLCRSGQPLCPFNPVTSCYGCSKFIPSTDKRAHHEAIKGMRAQVLTFLKSGRSESSPAALQLTQALAGAQQAIAAIASEKETA